MTDAAHPARRPVLVGVGTVHDRDPDLPGTPEPADLMVLAARRAVADAVGHGAATSAVRARLVDAVGSVAVPVGNWDYPDPARLVADALGAVGASTIRVEVGVSQQTPLRVAAEDIRAGRIDAALVVGAEAHATRTRILRAGGQPVETTQPGVEPDQRWSPTGEFMAQPEIDAGIWEPVEQYALIESALAAARGWDQDRQLDHVADLWARFNAVARTQPDAAFPEPREAAWLRAPGPGNRLLAHPYAKWHSTQWGVDQGAALLLCSTGLADELGVAPDRWVRPRVLVESSHAVSLTRRDRMDRWPAMHVLGAAAQDHLGAPLGDVPVVELYSCFPSAVQVQQRELGLGEDRTPTITGGMAFAGGPFNNFSYQAHAAVVRRLRSGPDATGLVTTVSGLLTKPALAVWSTDADSDDGGDEGRAEDLFADLADGARAATATREVTADATGPARVAAATATSTTRGSADRVVVVADLPDGRRWVGTSSDATLVRRVLDGASVGSTVRVDGTTCVPT